MWITLAILAILLVADQLTKYLTEINLAVHETVELIPHFLSATKVYNTGAAWSSFSNATWLLVVVSLVASIVLVYFATKNNWKKKKCYSIAITLMLAGTYGNLIDRFISVVYPKGRPGVVDMIIFQPLDSLWQMMTKSSFPIWNIADACLVIGIVVLAIDILFFQEKRAVK